MNSNNRSVAETSKFEEQTRNGPETLVDHHVPQEKAPGISSIYLRSFIQVCSSTPNYIVCIPCCRYTECILDLRTVKRSKGSSFVECLYILCYIACVAQEYLGTPERQSMTTSEVVEQIIQPLVGTRQCSLLLYAGLRHGGPAHLYVAHAWR